MKTFVSNLQDSQRGTSVLGILLIIIGIIIGVKLLIAIVPDQVGDYQLTKMLSSELKKANENDRTAKQFINQVNSQLSINADYDTKAEDVFTFTDKRVGNLALHKEYSKTHNFFANVDIVNRFEGDIRAEASP